MTRPRVRRSGDEVRRLIAAAARVEFAEHGFAGATTRDIAGRAGASEVLIFRHFGTKAALFEQVIFEPFDRLIATFLEAREENPANRLGGSRQFVESVYPFLRANADLLRAIARSGSGSAGAGTAIAHGLDNYFDRAAQRMRHQYALEGVEAEIPPEFGVRFGFGMLAAAILLEEWFFPDGVPAEEAMTRTLSLMLYKALSPPA